MPITPVLFIWMVMVPQPTDDKPRYLLVAARRLDLAQRLFDRVDDLRQSNPESGPAGRRAIFELIGATELAVVSLSRAMDMCINASSAIGTRTPVPSDVSSRGATVTAIRNAYEYIEDRALGKVRGNPHPDALTIFDHATVTANGVITYGSHQLGLTTDVPATISALRQFFKTAAGEALPATATTTYTGIPPTSSV